MSRSRFRAYLVKGPPSEAGTALLAFLLVLLVGGSYALLSDAKSLAQRAKLEESRKTGEALAEAKAALIGYAASANVIPTGTESCAANCPRPGDLPCPDQDNDGVAETNCADPSPPIDAQCAKTTGPPGPACRRLGRLPWKTLGLPDLRDGSGERLWYAVSTNFKNNTRTDCGSSGLPGCLNSDSRGTITIWDPSHTVRHHAGDNPDPYVPSGAVAVIIAPGPALQRQGGLDQDRGCTVGVDCDSNDVCTQPTLTTTPKCRAVNFLDGTTDEDNQQFIDGNNNNGFIQGDVFDVAANVIVNDRVLPVTYNDIMPLLERRVVGEVLTWVQIPFFIDCFQAVTQRPHKALRAPV